MLSYVVVAGKNARPLGDQVLAKLQHPDTPELFFRPNDHLAWTNAQRNLVFFGWQGATSAGEVGSHWHRKGDRLVAFSGHVWPRSGLWRRDPSWAEQLATYLDGRTAAGAREDLFGSYTISDLGSSGGVVMGDPFGSSPLYVAENDQVLAVSNRATLAALAVERPGDIAPRSSGGCGWLPYFAHVVGGQTSLAAVRALATGEYVRIDGRGEIVHSRSDSPVWRPTSEVDPQGRGREEMLDAVLDDLLTNIQAVAGLRTPRKRLRLSGGKDSRLVLALIRAAGVQDKFTCVTVGHPREPDVVVAQSLAAKAGIDLEVHAPPPSSMTEAQFEKRLLIHVFQTSGMVGAFTLKGSLLTNPDLVLSGLFGELFRSHYANKTTISSEADIRKFLLNDLRYDDGAILKEEARQHYASTVETWLDEKLEAGERPEDIADIFYIEHRLRRWFGAVHEVAGMSPQATPLQSVAGTRAAFALGHRSRQIDTLHFELTRRAAEDLAKHPLAKQRWHPDNYRHLPDADDYAAIEPYRGSSHDRSRRWQLAHWDANLPIVRKYLSSPSNPIYEVLDRSSVMKALDGGGELHAREQLYGALVGAVWLDGAELPARIEEKGHG